MSLRTISVAPVILAIAVASSSGAIITQPTSEAGWTATSSGGGAPNGVLSTGVLDGHANAGRIQNDTGMVPESDLVFSDDAIVVGGEGGLTGNYIGLSVRSMTAEFYAFQDFGVNPEDLRLYMLASGSVWYYDLGPQSAGWNSLSINMVHVTDPLSGVVGGWYNEDDRTLTQFGQDIASVTRFGFELNYVANQNNQTFGFDNFILYDTYFVPEPETYLMLAVALASLAFVFREQLRQSIRTALASVAG